MMADAVRVIANWASHAPLGQTLPRNDKGHSRKIESALIAVPLLMPIPFGYIVFGTPSQTDQLA